jgi:hypothetical protein
LAIPIPWRLKKTASNLVGAAHYYRNRAASAARGNGGKKSILFCIPFYGYTGGAFAVLSTANLLSSEYDVSFLTKPTNTMNKYAGPAVRMVSEITEAFDYCVTESGISPDDLDAIRRDGSIVILTMHGAPTLTDGTKNHGYSDQLVDKMMRLVDSVQYISDAQLPFFEGQKVHRRRVPNYVEQVKTHTPGRTAGIVCDTTLPHKNAALSVAMANRSNAERVEVWGKSAGQADTGKVRWNGFATDKGRIYGSIDVLVHLSKLECQPLVVLEAISAGIPCVLAPIPAYAHLQGLEGIYLVDLDDEDGIVKAINAALSCDRIVREGLAAFWERHHSPRAIRDEWTQYLQELSGLKGARAGQLALAGR